MKKVQGGLLEVLNIKEPPPITLDSVRISKYNNYYNTSCYDCRDGSIEVFITPNRIDRTYSYHWDTPDGQIESPGDKALYNLPYGIYTLELIDNFGCIFNHTFTIVRSPLVVNDTIQVFDTINVIVFDTTYITVNDTIHITVNDTVFQFETGCIIDFTDAEGKPVINLTQVEDYIFLSLSVPRITLFDLNGNKLIETLETDRIYVVDRLSGVYVIQLETPDNMVFTKRAFIY